MASTNKTPNLELPQWELSEKPEMADFNNAFENIEDFKDEFDSHKADYASLLAGGEVYTATLREGWTGDLYYSKNDLGVVSLWGRITAGTVANGTVIAVMPSGYYTKFNNMAFPVNNRDRNRLAFGLIMQIDGGLRVRDPFDTAAASGETIEFHIRYEGA